MPGGKLLIATLDWEPEVKDRRSRHRRVREGHGATKLEVHGRIEKPTSTQPARRRPTSHLRGQAQRLQRDAC